MIMPNAIVAAAAATRSHSVGATIGVRWGLSSGVGRFGYACGSYRNDSRHVTVTRRNGFVMKSNPWMRFQIGCYIPSLQSASPRTSTLFATAPLQHGDPDVPECGRVAVV